MPAPRRVYNHVIKAGVEQPLTAAGFAAEGGRGGRAWVQRVDDNVVWAVDVQAHRYPPPDTTAFTVNWGVLLPAAFEQTGNALPRQVPHAGLLQGRLNDVSKHDQADWWCHVTADTGEDVVEDVRHRIEDDLLPYLARYATMDVVVRKAEKKQLAGDSALLCAGWPGAAPLTVAAMLIGGETERAQTFVSYLSRKRFVPHLEAAAALLPSGR